MQANGPCKSGELGPAMRTTSQLRDFESTASFSGEMKLIPRWSIALAVVAFALMQYFFWVILPGQRHHPGPPISLRLYFAISAGALASLYALMAGYVSRDAPRRSMSRRLLRRAVTSRRSIISATANSTP